MIFERPPNEVRVDQGDLSHDWPILSLTEFDVTDSSPPDVSFSYERVVVLTQTCDLANEKTTQAVVAVVLEAQSLVDQKLLRVSDVRGAIRASRVYGWYFLPKCEEFGMSESIIDLRQLHTVRLDILQDLCDRGSRIARIQPLYREHLAKHFADTYSRIGLPEPYETK